MAKANSNVAVQRAFQVLESFTEQGPESTLAELSERLGVNVGTLHRLLGDLVGSGYLVRDDRRGSYRLGLKLIGLAKVAINTHDVRTEARPFLERLAVETGANVSLGVLDRGEVVYLDRIASPHAADPYFHGGRRVPAHCSSLGKVLLAFSDATATGAATSAALASYTENTIVSRQALQEELDEVRSAGFALDRAEYMSGTHCFGAPVYDSSGGVVAAISLSNTHTQLNPADVEAQAPLLLKTCSQVSQRLGLSLFTPHDRGSRTHFASR